VLKLLKAIFTAILSGLAIGVLIVVLIPSLRPQLSLNIEDWLLSVNSHISFSKAIKRSAPAVVNIYSVTQFINPQNQVERRAKGLGSGVIMSTNGFIMTNLHVIKGADIIYVAIQDGRVEVASVVGTDPFTDLAVLKIKTQHLPVIPMNLDRAAQVGDLVLAIGNPYNLGQTITQGIISATGRKAGLNPSSFLDLIQTDAAVNDGNSGGALINSRGNLVGINNAKFNSINNGTTNGISFAIPIKQAYAVMKELITEGRVSRGSLGFDGEAINNVTAMSLGLQTAAIAVTAIGNDSMAQKAGLRLNDIVIAVNTKPFSSIEELRHLIAGTKPGHAISLTVIRAGQQHTLEMFTAELTIK